MKLPLAVLACIALIVPGNALAIELTDTGAWVPGKSERKFDESGLPYETALLESSDGSFFCVRIDPPVEQDSRASG